MAVTPTGKDKVTKGMRLYVGPPDGESSCLDISGDSRSFDMCELVSDEVDATGWDEDTRTYLASHRTGGLRGYQALMNDANPTGSLRLLQDSGLQVPLVLAFGGRGLDPDYGDPVFMLPGCQIGHSVQIEGGAAVLSGIDFLPSSAETMFHEYRTWPFGYVIWPMQFYFSDSGGPAESIDLGQAWNDGWWAIEMAKSSSSWTGVVSLEHSTDDSAFSTLDTFDDATVNANGYQMIQGQSVNRYVTFDINQVSGTRTAGIFFAVRKRV